ncbi:MAG: metal-dependent transcriptional regulator [Gemmatimonadetes bacterium]|nr:metal-dependent transcriptional regulator [Gemmatimonadota bacterium]
MSAAAAALSTSLSRSIEDYLKTIYQIESAGTPAQTSTIADALNLAPPSVSGMLKRLAENGLIEHEPYRGVTLTPRGRRAALKVVRRHRILESYLMSKLGYDWDTVHDEAERMEHTASDQLVERMAMALGNPRYDPHGAPIPSPGGEVESPDLVSLDNVPLGEIAELRMVSDTEPERLRFLASLGLKPGARFEVLSRQPFRGPLTIRLIGVIPRDQVVGHELAETLWCSLGEKEAG